jgi:hypothetical protein
MNSSTKSHAHVLAGFLRSKNTTNPERMTLATNRMTIKRRIQLHTVLIVRPPFSDFYQMKAAVENIFRRREGFTPNQ